MFLLLSIQLSGHLVDFVAAATRWSTTGVNLKGMHLDCATAKVHHCHPYTHPLPGSSSFGVFSLGHLHENLNENLNVPGERPDSQEELLTTEPTQDPGLTRVSSQPSPGVSGQLHFPNIC